MLCHGGSRILTTGGQQLQIALAGLVGSLHVRDDTPGVGGRNRGKPRECDSDLRPEAKCDPHTHIKDNSIITCTVNIRLLTFGEERLLCTQPGRRVRRPPPLKRVEVARFHPKWWSMGNRHSRSREAPTARIDDPPSIASRSGLIGPDGS
jgi:hypothetical protein